MIQGYYIPIIAQPWCVADEHGRGWLPIRMFHALTPRAPARLARRAIELAEIMRGLAPTQEEYTQLVQDLIRELTEARDGGPAPA